MCLVYLEILLAVFWICKCATLELGFWKWDEWYKVNSLALCRLPLRQSCSAAVWLLLISVSLPAAHHCLLMWLANSAKRHWVYSHPASVRVWHRDVTQWLREKQAYMLLGYQQSNTMCQELVRSPGWILAKWSQNSFIISKIFDHCL